MGRYIVKLDNCKTVDYAVKRLKEKFEPYKNFVLDFGEKTDNNICVKIYREDKKEINLTGTIGIDTEGYYIDYELSYGDTLDLLNKSTTIITVVAAVLGIAAGVVLKDIVTCTVVILIYIIFYIVLKLKLDKCNVIFDVIFDCIKED